jgi:hypothetical protein
LSKGWLSSPNRSDLAEPSFKSTCFKLKPKTLSTGTVGGYGAVYFWLYETAGKNSGVMLLDRGFAHKTFGFVSASQTHKTFGFVSALQTRAKRE